MIYYRRGKGTELFRVERKKQGRVRLHPFMGGTSFTIPESHLKLYYTRLK